MKLAQSFPTKTAAPIDSYSNNTRSEGKESRVKPVVPSIDYRDLFEANFKELKAEFGFEQTKQFELYRAFSKADLKRELKSIQSRRAVEMGARLSGPGCDPKLRESIKLATKIETEQTRLRELRRTSRFGSSLLVCGGAMMAIDDQLSVLEELRAEMKEDVRHHKERIKEECLARLDCGSKAEECVLHLLQLAEQSGVRTKAIGGRGNRGNVAIKTGRGERRGSRGAEEGASFLVDGQDVMFALPKEESNPLDAENLSRLLTSVEEVFSQFEHTKVPTTEQGLVMLATASTPHLSNADVPAENKPNELFARM